MATINSTAKSALLQTPPALAAVKSALTSSASESSGDVFGNAYTLSLSGSSTSSANGSSPTAAPAPGGAPAGGPPGGGVPVTGTTTSTDLATLIEEAKNRAAVDVGYTEAANVVDSDGNIDTAKLQQIKAQQAAQAAEQKQVLNPTTSQSAGQSINLVA